MRQKTRNEKVWEQTFLGRKFDWKPMLKCKLHRRFDGKWNCSYCQGLEEGYRQIGVNK